MKTPRWLDEFYHQWARNRGRRLSGAKMPFSRPWEDLLDAAGLHSAEERGSAAREAEVFIRSGHLLVTRYQHRVLHRVRLPLESEAWLCRLYGAEPSSITLNRSMVILGEASLREHPLYPDLWRKFCASLGKVFAAGKNIRPFSWQHPDHLKWLLELTLAVSGREWPAGTLIREVDVALGLATKTIEGHRRSLQQALTQLFQRATPLSLEALNIITTNSRLHFDGPLRIEFEDGSLHEAGNLRHGDFVTAADLQRAVRVSTTATRILSIENSKTTFRRFAERNAGRNALIIATSFPTTAVRRLLEKLPVDLPHFHFGDTDPAGFLILLKLREATARPVAAWQMNWRDTEDSPLLSLYDRRILDRLLASPEMKDCHETMRQMLTSGHKGDYEQEFRRTSGLP